MRIPARLSIATTGLALAAALALTGCVPAGGSGSGAAGSDSKPAGSAAPAGGSNAKPSQAAPGLGTPVKVGTLEYTVSSVQAAGGTIGSSPLSHDAQGTYFRVELKVANLGDAATTFALNYVKLKDAAGKTYDADSTGSIYLGDDGIGFDSINPGNTLEGAVVFDVPEGTQPAAILVSDNMFSAGTAVSVG